MPHFPIPSDGHQFRISPGLQRQIATISEVDSMEIETLQFEKQTFFEIEANMLPGSRPPFSVIPSKGSPNPDGSGRYLSPTFSEYYELGRQPYTPPTYFYGSNPFGAPAPPGNYVEFGNVAQWGVFGANWASDYGAPGTSPFAFQQTSTDPDFTKFNLRFLHAFGQTSYFVLQPEKPGIRFAAWYGRMSRFRVRWARSAWLGQAEIYEVPADSPSGYNNRIRNVQVLDEFTTVPDEWIDLPTFETAETLLAGVCYFVIMLETPAQWRSRTGIV